MMEIGAGGDVDSDLCTDSDDSQGSHDEDEAAMEGPRSENKQDDAMNDKGEPLPLTPRSRRKAAAKAKARAWEEMQQEAGTKIDERLNTVGTQ